MDRILRYFLILVGLILIVSLTYAQEIDKVGTITGKGNVYLTNGDTLKGIINYPTSDFRKIYFQKLLNEKSQKLKIPTFKAFTIELDSFIVLYNLKIQCNEFRSTKISMPEGIVEVSLVGNPISLYIHHSFQSRTSPSIIYGMTIEYEPILSYILYSQEFENMPYKTLTTLKTKKLTKELFEYFGKHETLRPLITESISNPKKIRSLVIGFNKLSFDKK